MSARTARTSESGPAKWWRFSRYELRDGYLRPAPKARLEAYDPWAGYQAARLKGKTEPPYRALLALLDRLSVAGGQPALNPMGRDALLEWCADYGLLGLLPHRAQMMILAPRWVPAGYADRQLKVTGVEEPRFESAKVPPPEMFDHYDTDTEDIEPPSVLEAASSVYVRSGNRWHSTLATWRSAPTSDTNSDQAGQPVPVQLLPSVLSQVVLSGIGDTLIADVPIAEGVGPFFPDVPPDQRADYHYPLPLTDAFWREYAEPVEDFLAAALAFRDAAEGVSTIKHGGQGVRLTPKIKAKVSAALQTLHTLTAPVRPVLELGPKGAFRQAWAPGSLLASFALMLQQDADDGWRVVRCEACGEVFTTHDTRVQFCSERCRWRLVKRAQRRRQ